MPESKHKSRHVMRAFSETPWAITREKFDQIHELLELRASGVTLTEAEVQARIGAVQSAFDDAESEQRGYMIQDGVAIIPVHGVLSPRLNMMQRISGGTSTQQLSASIRRAVADPNVKAVVMDVDSPGGSALGCAECSTAIAGSRGEKRIVAVTEGLCASAAYFIASAADEVVASESSMLGSIGTLLVHREVSKALDEAGIKYTVIQQGKFKTDGHQFAPLSDQARNTLQERVDDYYAQFVRGVAGNRDVSVETVEQNFGQGKVLIAAKAVRAGLADRIGTLSDVVRQLSASAPSTRPSGAAASHYRTEVRAVDIIKAALLKRGLIEKDANDEAVKVALRTFYGLAGKTQPDASTADGQAEIVQDLRAEKAAAKATPAKTPEPKADAADSTVDIRLAEKQAREAEKTRIMELTERGETLGIAQADVQAAISNGTSLEDALRDWTAKMAKKEKPIQAGADITVEGSSLDTFAAAAVEVISHRIGAVTDEEQRNGLSQAAADMRNMRLSEMAGRILTAAGRRVHGLDAEETCRQYLEMGGDFLIPSASQGGYNRPGQYPNLLAAVAGKALDAAMIAAPVTYQSWAYQRPSVADFHPRTIVRKGGRGELPEWPDGDEITDDTTAEEVSFIRVDRYGDEFALTPVMMANDDLNAFSESAMDVMNAHERTINRLGIDLLIGNATAADGYALFDDTNHGNDLTGAAPSIAQAKAVRQKMQKQTDVSGRFKIGLSPALVLCGSEQLTEAQQVFLPVSSLERIAKATDATINVFRGTVDVVFDPMIDDASTAGLRNDWFTFANKRQARSLVYMFQTGYQAGGKRRSYFNNRTGSRHFQVEGRFGFAIGNWRGVVRNGGGS